MTESWMIIVYAAGFAFVQFCMMVWRMVGKHPDRASPCGSRLCARAPAVPALLA